MIGYTIWADFCSSNIPFDLELYWIWKEPAPEPPCIWDSAQGSPFSRGVVSPEMKLDYLIR